MRPGRPADTKGAEDRRHACSPVNRELELQVYELGARALAAQRWPREYGALCRCTVPVTLAMLWGWESGQEGRGVWDLRAPDYRASADSH